MAYSKGGMIQVNVVHTTLLFMTWINPSEIVEMLPLNAYGYNGGATTKITMKNGHCFDTRDTAEDILSTIENMKRADARLFLEVQGLC